jgi:hypothetical protein
MKFSNSFLLLAVAAMTGNCMLALDVNVAEPGSLSTRISDTSTEALSVSGNINAQDLYFIGSSLPKLSLLDLSDAAIVACTVEQPQGNVECAANLIPDAAFVGAKLTQVTLPQSVTVGDMAFAGCSELMSVTVSDGAAFGAYAFSDCHKLMSIDNAANVTAIGDYAFRNCSRLSTYTFGSGLKTVGEGAFYASGLSVADFSNAASVTTIGNWAFADCKSLETIKFADDAQGITVGSGTFFGCTKLADIALPQLAKIDDFALANTSSVSSLTLPASLTYVGENAMAGMTGLTTIDATALSTVPALGDDVWRNVEQSNVYLNANVAAVNSFKEAEQWQDFSFSSIATSTADAVTVPNVRARFSGTDLQIVATDCTLGSVALYDPSGVMLTSLAVNAESVTVSTADYQTRIYIVNIKLSNGSNASLKIIRK